jgi:hypothetical protein
MYCKYCRKFPHLSDRKDALTRGTKNLRIDGFKLHDKHQEHLLCVKHWLKELDDPQGQAAAGIFNLYFTYQFIIWKWFSSFDNTVAVLNKLSRCFLWLSSNFNNDWPGSSLTGMLRKCTASTVEHFHTCQIGKMPLLGELKSYALMDLSYT